MSRSTKTIILSITMAVLMLFAVACEGNPTTTTYTSYTVTFNTDGGSTIADRQSSTSTGLVDKPSDPTKNGYTFDDWYTQSTGGTAFSFDTIITANLTLYARWTPIASSDDDDTDELSGTYLVSVAAWHETNDAASMMADMLYEKAFIEADENGIEVTFYFIPAVIMTIPVSPATIEDVKYSKDGSTLIAAQDQLYDPSTDVLAITIELEQLNEFTKIQMTESSNTRTIRLKIDSTTLDESTTAPSFHPVEQQLAEGTYSIPVAAWHATNDAASMMNPLLHGTAFVEIGSETITVTIYFVNGQVQPPVPSVPAQNVESSSITAFKYTDIGASEMTDAVLTYNAIIGVNTATLVFSTTDINELEYVASQVSYPSNANLRLKLAIADAEAADSAPSFPVIEGTYSIPVAAWHATNDAASMMNPLLHGTAFVEIGSETITVTIYFVNGQVQPPVPSVPAQNVESSSITAFKYTDIGASEMTDAVLTYNAIIGVNTATLVFSTTDINELEYVASQVSYPSNANLRLKLAIADAEAADSAPSFPVIEGTYSIPVAAWHATNDAASMMASMLYGFAFVEIGSETITVTIYFVNTTIMGQSVAYTAVTNVRYTSDETLTDATLSVDSDLQASAVTLVFDTTDLDDIQMNVCELSYKMNPAAVNPTVANIRLNFTFASAEATATSPIIVTG